ncbi:MurR/RpiR family transcriptional regulator [Chromohalobacter salexigens]|nr:MurR/RpiR family transcriptional regulator [Chromohalobacter salexigens]
MSAENVDLPPRRYADLQLLALRARRGDAADLKLSAKGLALLEALLAQPEAVSLSGISQLAQHHGVNPSRLTRLAHALGLEGFKALQALFREDLSDSAFYSTRAQRLLDFGETPRAEGDALADDRALWQQEMQNLSAAVEALDTTQLAAAVASIQRAWRIHVIGLRASFGAAHYLAYYLDYLRDGVHLVSGHAGVSVEQALRLGEGDLVIGIAFRPESRMSIDYCRLAVEQGASLLALTNHSSSQLAALSESTLLAPAEGAFFFNPMSSLFMLVELLLSRVAREMGHDAVLALRQREALISRLHVE